MNYTCEKCNYITQDKRNFYKHQKTKSHSSNLDTNISKCTIQSTSSLPQVYIKSTLIDTSTPKLLITNYKCKNCEFETIHKSSYYRHNKICNNINSFVELKLKLEFEKKEKEIYQKMEEEKSELLTNFMANANILLNKANDNTKITAQAMQSVSVSALKYANDKFKDTPALLPLENFNINNLSFETDKKQLTEILIYNIKQKSLDKLLGDHIVKCYKKENPEEQSFHTTDCSRLNYIVRNLIQDALSWSVDKNGIKICSSIIKPLIEKCIGILMEYQKELIEEMTHGNYQNKETVTTIINMLMSIDKGELESDINKYIAPFFNLNKS